MLAIAATIIFAQGWRLRLIALAAGALGALALSPFDIFPAMFVPMTVAVWLLDGAGEAFEKPALVSSRPSVRNLLAILLPKAARRAFWSGWWWGFGYFLASLWWLGAAFLVEAEEFAWALPLGVVGLPAFLAVFPALGFLLARLVWSLGPARICAFSAALTFAEWLRGHVLTGFPWNAFGMALGGNLDLGQLASVIGLYGLTLAATLVFAAPATLVSRAPFLGHRQVTWHSSRFLFLALLALGASWSFGAVRLAGGHAGVVEGVKLRIMQPGLTQDENFRPENKAAILAYYIGLSEGKGLLSAGLADVTALIWPESAFPFILARDRAALAEIGAILAPGQMLMTGAARQAHSLEQGDVAGVGEPKVEYFNSIQIVGRAGRILDTYDKVHLVPFGEYLPFRSLFDRLGVRQFVHIPGGFEPGTARRILRPPGLPPIAPVICYEAIFPAEVVPPSEGMAPGWILNVTDDGWFGRTAGPYQHFAQARLRAIEEGLPLVRAATTGISAIIDPYGRILADLPLGEAGALDGPLPQRIVAPLFARFPVLSPFICWVIVLAVGAAGHLWIDRPRLGKY